LIHPRTLETCSFVVDKPIRNPDGSLNLKTLCGKLSIIVEEDVLWENGYQVVSFRGLCDDHKKLLDNHQPRSLLKNDC